MDTQTKIEVLADLFRRAQQAAIAADPGDGFENDGGTCNMDTPAFRVKRMRDETMLQAAELAGVKVEEFEWRGGCKWWWLRVPLYGQAERRSKMMGAAQSVLRDFQKQNDAATDPLKGFEQCGWYQMD